MAASVLKEGSDAPALLPLGSFRVAGFRAFRDLCIGELGRVNLFVGRNNVGKSSLLEAVDLYAGRASPSRIKQLLLAREEITYRARPEPEALDAAVTRLFHAGERVRASKLTLGPLNHPAGQLTIQRGWATTLEFENSISTRFSSLDADDLPDVRERALEVRFGNAHVRVIPDRQLPGRTRFGTALIAATDLLYPSHLVPAGGFSTESIAYLWDRVALTDEEDLVTDALRIITPDVERISAVGDAEGTQERRVLARVQGQSSPVPLRTMGDGMNRLLGMTLALAAARGGVLLVDEIENGIHYSVQADMWRTVLRAASSLNVQVFATTHSWDCIRAFAAAVSEAPSGDAMLYRLDRRNDGDVRAVRYTAEEVAIAAEQAIEVR